MSNTINAVSASDDSPPVIDFKAMAAAQNSDPYLQRLRTDSSLQLQAVPLDMSDATIWCDLTVRCPSTLTTDRGRQFQSDLWSSLMKLLGTKHIHTTSYHPIANGLMERFHRQLKSALKAQQQSKHWVDALPLVLLGCRTAIKEDLSCTAAEFLYGTTFRLPGEFVSPATQHDFNPAQFVGRLKATMSTL